MSELKMSIQQQLNAIEAQWDEEDPQILEAAREFLKDELSTEEEEEKILEVKLEEKLDDMSLNENNLEEKVVDETSKEDLNASLPKDWRYASSHPKELIIGDTLQEVKTRSSLRYMNNITFISQIEPKNIKEDENDPN